MKVRPMWRDVLLAVWLGMILPGIGLNLLVLEQRQDRLRQLPVEKPQVQQTEEPFILVSDQDGRAGSMDPETYLTGVLLAEMPSEFHREALKAQSVAARTYVWKAFTTGGKHGDNSVCMDSACCQAYMTSEDYLARGGTLENLEKLRKAVEDTVGMVLAYDGELIEATYFSSAGGSTESAVAVWGADYPYLQAVTSPEPIRTETVSYARDIFFRLLGIPEPREDESMIGSVAYTEGGGVATMEICGHAFTGTQLRAILGLSSTDLEISTVGDMVRITTRGYGHRVGLSQYGANALAESGYTWQEILQHYYPGTTLYPAY